MALLVPRDSVNLTAWIIAAVLAFLQACLASCAW